MPTSVHRRWPTARRSPNRSRLITRTRSRPAGPASSPASRSSPNRCRQPAGSYSKTKSSVARCPRSTFPESRKGSPVLLEPIMKVEVVTPEEYTGSVIGDLNSRRGQIQGQDMRGNANVVNAMVPLANMFGYVSNLRSMSQGRATFTMQFHHYAEVPRAVAEEIQAKFA